MCFCENVSKKLSAVIIGGEGELGSYGELKCVPPYYVQILIFALESVNMTLFGNGVSSLHGAWLTSMLCCQMRRGEA